jgi:hypothetical protein
LSYQHIDRRKHPRLVSTIPLKICSDDVDLVTEARNISCSGTYCEVNRYIEPMTKLKIHLLLTMRRNGRASTKKISCQGVVVRSESLPGQESYNVAIFFNDINLRDMTILKEFISSLIEEEKLATS